jgi:hypothetical protein
VLRAWHLVLLAALPDSNDQRRPGGLFIHRIFDFSRSETLMVGATESFPQFHRQR